MPLFIAIAILVAFATAHLVHEFMTRELAADEPQLDGDARTAPRAEDTRETLKAA